MNDPLILLHSALGQPGSGRTRYDAAMALHRDGLLSDAQLKVYRIASADDGRDPQALLTRCRLPVPLVGADCPACGAAE